MNEEIIKNINTLISDKEFSQAKEQDEEKYTRKEGRQCHIHAIIASNRSQRAESAPSAAMTEAIQRENIRWRSNRDLS